MDIVPLHSIPENLLKQVASSYGSLVLWHNTPHKDNRRQTCLGLMIEDLYVGLRVGLCEDLHANHEGPRGLLAQEGCGQGVGGGGMGLAYVHYSIDEHFQVGLCSEGCRGLNIETFG